MNLRSVLVLMVCGALVLAACGSSDKASQRDTASAPQSRWLFAFPAERATFTDTGVQLTGIADSSTAFTDRPQRNTEVQSTPSLFAAWPALFASSAANVAFVGFRGSESVEVVYEVSGVKVDAEGAATFTGKPLSGGAPEPLDRVSVLVDDAPAVPCNAQIPWYDRMLQLQVMATISATGDSVSAPVTVSLFTMPEQDGALPDVTVSVTGSNGTTTAPSRAVDAGSFETSIATITVKAPSSWAQVRGAKNVVLSVQATFPFKGVPDASATCAISVPLT